MRHKLFNEENQTNMANQDKAMRDFHRILSNQNFETEVELKKFVQSLAGKPIPNPPVKNRSDEAEDLVYQAIESPGPEGLKLVRKALKIDKNCILAYEYLGGNQHNPNKAKEFFKKGIQIGDKKFGGQYEEENRGHFWGILETRPYMRCLFEYAECHYLLGHVKEAIKQMEKILILNPNDNQGVRYPLSTYYLKLGELQKFDTLVDNYEDDFGIFFHYNIPLRKYMEDGSTKITNEILRKAVKRNEFVADKLINLTDPPEPSNGYAIGSEEEANYYLYFSLEMWQDVKGALNWLREIIS